MVRRCEIQEEDYDFLKSSFEEIKMLSGMVIEIVQDNPSMLLSPTFRELLTRQAIQVQKLTRFLSYQSLVVDNLGDTLQNQFNKITTKE